VAKTKGSRPTYVVLAGGGLVILLMCWFWFARPPQMGADPEVFKTVDALFTAVTARDEKLLGQCERRLSALESAGRLPGKASSYISGIIARAHDGRWQSAAEQLYAFMRAQRPDHQTRDKESARAAKK
jgi:hypothetical protein